MSVATALSPDLAVQLLLASAAKGSVVLLVAAVVAWLLRRRQAAIRHGIWATALAIQLALPLLELALPEWPVRVLPRSASAPASASTMTSPTVVGDAGAPAPREAGAMAQPGIIADQPPSRSSTIAIALIAIWATGMLVVLLRLVIGTIAVWRTALGGERVGDGRWLALAQQLSSSLGIRRPMTLLRGSRLGVPVTWGIVYPVVLLPDDADRWPAARRRYVLVHEMAHVKRLDALTQLVAQLALAAFWFNPLVWIAARRVQIEREHACDDYVIRHGTRPSEYAADLLEIVRAIGTPGHRTPFPAFATLAMARCSEFEGRMLSILDPSLDRTPVSRNGVLMITAFAVLLAVPLATLTLAPRADAALSAAPTPATTANAVPPAGTPVTAKDACDTAHFSGTSTSHHVRVDSDHADRRILEYVFASASRCLHSRVIGHVSFTPDDAGISTVAPGAMVFVRERVPGADRQLTVTRAADGSLRFEYALDGVAAPFDADARAWFGAVLPRVLREAAIDAPRRVARLYSAGGTPRVLDLITSIQSTGGRRAHYEAFFALPRLAATDVERALRQARGDLPSDGDLRAVLATVPIPRAGSPSASRAYADAIAAIQSDGDRSASAILAATRPDVSDELLAAIAGAALGIHSDGDKARFLLATTAPYLARSRAALADDWFAVARSIESAGDRANVLVAAAPFGARDPRIGAHLIRAARGIVSDGDLSRTLIVFAQHRLHELPQLRAAYMEAVRGIASDGDRARVLDVITRP